MLPLTYKKNNLGLDRRVPNTPSARSESGGLLRRLVRNAVRQSKRRRMIGALHAMDDWLLRDIGLDRDDIPRLVDGLSDRELRMNPLKQAQQRAPAMETGYMMAA